MSLIISFIVIYGLVYVFHAKADHVWLRALTIAASFVVFQVLVTDFGAIGWCLSVISAFYVVTKVMRYNFSTAFLFIVTFGIIEMALTVGLQQLFK